jgi:membrane fusion protein, multidrug efflux system
MNTHLFCIGCLLALVSSQPAAQTVKPPTPSANPTSKSSSASPANLVPLPSTQTLTPFATANPPSEVSLVRVLLTPDKETTIASSIAAKVVVFNGTLGQSFKAGDVLVRFDCEESMARVEMSKAELSGSIDQHEAKVKMQGLGQASDVEVALAASQVNKGKAQLSLNQTQVSQCTVVAPWDGRVAKANVKTFMTATPGQPLMELVNDGPLRIKLNAPSKLLGKIKPGSGFTVQIDETNGRYPATVTAINSRVDSVSQTVELEGRLTRSYRELLPGMSGIADLSSIR